MSYHSTKKRLWLLAGILMLLPQVLWSMDTPLPRHSRTTDLSHMIPRSTHTNSDESRRRGQSQCLFPSSSPRPYVSVSHRGKLASGFTPPTPRRPVRGGRGGGCSSGAGTSAATTPAPIADQALGRVLDNICGVITSTDAYPRDALRIVFMQPPEAGRSSLVINFFRSIPITPPDSKLPITHAVNYLIPAPSFPGANIIQACVFHQIFSAGSRAKIVLVISKPYLEEQTPGVYYLLASLADAFSHDLEQLQKSMLLVFEDPTDDVPYDPYLILSNFLEPDASRPASTAEKSLLSLMRTKLLDAQSLRTSVLAQITNARLEEAKKKMLASGSLAPSGLDVLTRSAAAGERRRLISNATNAAIIDWHAEVVRLNEAGFLTLEDRIHLLELLQTVDALFPVRRFSSPASSPLGTPVDVSSCSGADRVRAPIPPKIIDGLSYAGLLTPAEHIALTAQQQTEVSASTAPNSDPSLESLQKAVRTLPRAPLRAATPTSLISSTVAEELLRRAIAKVVSFIEENAVNHIRDHCQGIIDTPQVCTYDLRKQLLAVDNKLRKLAALPALTLEGFTPYLPSTGMSFMEGSIKSITLLANFLEEMTQDFVMYNLSAWITALPPIGAAIAAVTSPPKLSSIDGTATIQGPIVSTSDLNGLKGWLNNVTNVRVFAFNTFNVDSSLQLKGMDLWVFAPHWNIYNDFGITLLGHEGEPGADGRVYGADGTPGGHGGNGGNFWGLGSRFTNPNLLSVITKGGAGGRGGNGAPGKPGERGRPASLFSATQVVVEVRISHPRDGNAARIKVAAFGQGGGPGSPGGNGAPGGLGGRPGQIAIFGNQGDNNIREFPRVGLKGNDGSPGVGGVGGTPGEDAYKVVDLSADKIEAGSSPIATGGGAASILPSRPSEVPRRRSRTVEPRRISSQPLVVDVGQLSLTEIAALRIGRLRSFMNSLPKHGPGNVINSEAVRESLIIPELLTLGAVSSILGPFSIQPIPRQTFSLTRDNIDIPRLLTNTTPHLFFITRNLLAPASARTSRHVDHAAAAGSTSFGTVAHAAFPPLSSLQTFAICGRSRSTLGLPGINGALGELLLPSSPLPRPPRAPLPDLAPIMDAYTQVHDAAMASDFALFVLPAPILPPRADSTATSASGSDTARSSDSVTVSIPAGDAAAAVASVSHTPEIASRTARAAPSATTAASSGTVPLVTIVEGGRSSGRKLERKLVEIGTKVVRLDQSWLATLHGPFLRTRIPEMPPLSSSGFFTWLWRPFADPTTVATETDNAPTMTGSCVTPGEDSTSEDPGAPTAPTGSPAGASAGLVTSIVSATSVATSAAASAAVAVASYLNPLPYLSAASNTPAAESPAAAIVNAATAQGRSSPTNALAGNRASSVSAASTAEATAYAAAAAAARSSITLENSNNLPIICGSGLPPADNAAGAIDGPPLPLDVPAGGSTPRATAIAEAAAAIGPSGPSRSNTLITTRQWLARANTYSFRRVPHQPTAKDVASSSESDASSVRVVEETEIPLH